MKTKLLYLFLFFTLASFVQDKAKTINWKDLEHVHYRHTYSTKHNNWHEKPIFDISIQRLYNDTIQLSGYIVAMKENNITYLSANPNNDTCELFLNYERHTRVEINFKDTLATLEKDIFLTVQGILKTNDDSVSDFIYTLENAILTHD